MAKGSRFLTVESARAVDIKAREEFGIPTLVLMENAARAVAGEALKVKRAKKSVAVFCGKGNNGGDGFAAARHLLVAGIKPDIFLAGNTRDVKNEAGVNLGILLKLKQKIIEVREGNLRLVRRKVSRCSYIIDALLGVGLAGGVRGIYRDLIGLINASGAYVLSVDIPSGLDAASGEVLGCCVKADKTVTFVAPKRGMLTGDGPEYCGKIVVKDLGVPYLR